MRFLKLPVLAFLALLGTLGLGALRVPSPPDLFLLPVAEVARRGAPVHAMLAGLLLGLLEDVVRTPPRLLGLHAFSKVLLGYLLASVAARTIVDKPPTVAGALTLAVLLESAVLLLLLWVLRGEAMPPDPLALAIRAGGTAAVGALLFAASRVNWRARILAARRRRVR